MTRRDDHTHATRVQRQGSRRNLPSTCPQQDNFPRLISPLHLGRLSVVRSFHYHHHLLTFTPAMADRPRPPSPQPQRPFQHLQQQHPTTLLRKLHDHLPNSAQLIGLLTLIISGGILLLLSGFTLTAIVLGFIFFLPVILLTSPVWVPLAAVMFVVVSGVVAFGLVVGGGSWVYKYLSGRRPVGAERVDFARSRIAEGVGHMKEYLHGKGRDDAAAPGA